MSYCFAGALHDNLGGRAQGKVERDLAHELTFGRERDQVARLVRISVDRVIVGREQVAVGCQGQADRPAEVRLIVVNQGTPRSFKRLPRSENTGHRAFPC